MTAGRSPDSPPTDFTLDVDGRSRRIVSAQYVSSVREAAAACGIPVDLQLQHRRRRPADHVRRRSRQHRARAGPPGDGSREPLPRPADAGRSRRAHRLPGAGPIIDFTSNHAVVQSALPGLTGLTDTFPSSYRIGDREALAIVQGDRTALNTVVQRECTTAPSAEERDLCLRQVVTDSNGIFSSVNERTQTALTTLRLLVDRLSQTPTPKTIVYISEGLVLERRATAPGWVRRRRADRSRFMRSSSTSSGRTRRRPASRSRRGATRRSRTKGSASSPARRAARCSRSWATPTTRSRVSPSSCPATTSSSFEPESGDRDGKPHRIKVAVPARSGSTSERAASSRSRRRRARPTRRS